MDIILLDDIEKVGDKHEIVSVRPGYARNYLIPQGLALVANKSNRGRLDDIKRKELEELAARKAEFEAIAEKIKGQVLKIGAKAIGWSRRQPDGAWPGRVKRGFGCGGTQWYTWPTECSASVQW